MNTRYDSGSPMRQLRSRVRPATLMVVVGLALGAMSLSTSHAQGRFRPGGYQGRNYSTNAYQGQGGSTTNGSGRATGGAVVSGTVVGGNAAAGTVTLRSSATGALQTLRVSQGTRYMSTASVTTSSLRVNDFVHLVGVATSGAQAESVSGRVVSTNPLTIATSSGATIPINAAYVASATKLVNGSYSSLSVGDQVQASVQQSGDGALYAEQVGINVPINATTSSVATGSAGTAGSGGATGMSANGSCAAPASSSTSSNSGTTAAGGTSATASSAARQRVIQARRR